MTSPRRVPGGGIDPSWWEEPAGPGDADPRRKRGELGIADRLNWDMDYSTQSSYTPTEYSSPWEAEGWGSEDVATTPPTKLQIAQAQVDATPTLAQKPGFIEGQRDYVFMPTEKEQRREKRAQALELATARGTRWQDIPLPGGSGTPKPTYGRWQDAELPNWQPAPDRDEVSIQPVLGPRDDDDTVWTGGSRDFDESTGTYRPRPSGPRRPRRPRGTWINNETGQPWKSSGRGDSSPGTRPGQADRPESWDDDPRLQEYTFQVSEDQSRPVKGLDRRPKKLPSPRWDRDPTPPGKPPIEDARWGVDVGPGTSSPYGYGGPRGVMYSRSEPSRGMRTSSTRDLRGSYPSMRDVFSRR